MKKLILIIPILTIFGCYSYVQLFETESVNTKTEEGFYVYKTDTVKLTYSFWAEKGILSFSIFNKLNVPIYIDWKKSSYIDNANKLNYWIDEEKIESVSYYGGYLYSSTLLKSGYATSSGKATSFTTKISPERITFIPPKSIYRKSQFCLLPIDYFELSVNAKSYEVNRNDSPKKITMVYEQSYSKELTPLVFRNFLTFSLSEDFKEEFYIDNEFYISNIKEMDLRHFVGKYLGQDKNYKDVYEYPSKSPTSFYLYMPVEYKSIEIRNKYEIYPKKTDNEIKGKLNKKTKDAILSLVFAGLITGAIVLSILFLL